MMQNRAVTSSEICHMMIDLSNHHIILLRVRSQVEVKCKWDIGVRGKKKKKERQNKLIPRRIDGEVLELLQVLSSSCSSQTSPSRTDNP